MTQRLRLTALTHRGAVRKANEDTIGIGTWASHADLDAPVERLVDMRQAVACAVADGMGGHQGGSLASRFVVSRLGREGRDLTDTARVSAFLGRLDADLVRLGMEHEFDSPPGSTLAAVIFRPDGNAIVFNIGDSRIYRLDRSGVRQLSVDDTPGGIAGPDGRTGSQGHVLTQAIGGKRAPERLTLHLRTERAAAGDCFLLCSDGVTDVIGDSEIATLAARHAGDDGALADAIFRLAMDRGGPDNISLCIARLSA